MPRSKKLGALKALALAVITAGALMLNACGSDPVETPRREGISPRVLTSAEREAAEKLAGSYTVVQAVLDAGFTPTGTGSVTGASRSATTKYWLVFTRCPSKAYPGCLTTPVTPEAPVMYLRLTDEVEKNAFKVRENVITLDGGTYACVSQSAITGHDLELLATAGAEKTLDERALKLGEATFMCGQLS